MLGALVVFSGADGVSFFGSEARAGDEPNMARDTQPRTSVVTSDARIPTNNPKVFSLSEGKGKRAASPARARDRARKRQTRCGVEERERWAGFRKARPRTTVS
jgi:hypothetical protein